MRVYIAGPMRAEPDWGARAFGRAKALLASLGHEPVSPADLDRAEGIAPCGAGDGFGVEGWHRVMRRDLGLVMGCDAVALLPNWHASRGARAERFVAETVGIPIWRVVPDDGAFYPESVIGIAGRARAGKDTLGRVIAEIFGYERAAFARPLKAMLSALDPLVPVPGCDRPRRLAEVVGEEGWERAKEHAEVRRLLQRLGTEAGRRCLWEDVWVYALVRSATSGRVVVTDVRFRNEAMAIKERGGIVVRVERPGAGPLHGTEGRHVSETELDSWDFDAVVVNDGSLSDLVEAAKRLPLGEASLAPA